MREGGGEGRGGGEAAAAREEGESGGDEGGGGEGGGRRAFETFAIIFPIRSSAWCVSTPPSGVSRRATSTAGAAARLQLSSAEPFSALGR